MRHSASMSYMCNDTRFIRLTQFLNTAFCDIFFSSMASNVLYAMVVAAMIFATPTIACDDILCPALDCIDPATNPHDPCCQMCPNGKCYLGPIILTWINFNSGMDK